MRAQVPFTLTVTRGAGAGAEFPFDNNEARLGRTADNDIVVKDSGASRSHARVFQKGTRYFVEDMKSANGTKVNSAVITGVKELKNGDTITIGEVTFTFSFAQETLLKPPSVELDETMLKPGDDVTGEAPAHVVDHTTEQPALDINSTVLRSAPTSRGASDPERERPTTHRRNAASRSGMAVPKNDDESGPPSRAGRIAAADSETQPPSRAKRPSGEVDELANGTAEISIPPRALARRSSGGHDELKASDQGTAEVAVPPALVRRGGGKATDDGDADELTAADKLRLRRQAQKTALGKLTFAFGELPKAARVAIIALSSVFTLGLAGLIVVSVLPKKQTSAGPEPSEISGGAPTIEPSFGLGDGVTFERSDMKIFNFTAAAATRIVGVLHYQARDITKDEVAVSINGFDLGFVPPDTLDTATRELELVLPAQQIKRGESNQLIFDNTRNPPGEDSWRVWNLWLELIAIPDMSPEETINAVKEDLERSEKFFDQRDIGSDNLFKAWKGYREAWLKLESMPNRPDELYILARSQQREIAVLLDKRCSMLVLDYQKAMNAKRAERKKARTVAEDMLRYFPSREHRCHGLGRELLEDLGGL